MSGELAFYGGSFNPPTIAHQAIVDHLLSDEFFTEVLVKPCGLRADKPELLETLELRKASVISKLSRENQQYNLDISAMDQAMLPTVKEWERLQERWSGRVWIICGTDLFLDEGHGRCQIQRWVEGQRLFSQAHFCIFPRPVEGKWFCPPHARLIEGFTPLDISSSELRARGDWS